MDRLNLLVSLLCMIGSAPIHGADTEYLRSSIEDYFGYNRHHATNATYKDRARQHIYDEFRKFGLETEYHTFNYTTLSSTEEFHNVIGILKGRRFGKSNDRILGLGAHYDTVTTTSGVDDNGSGVAALLEVARRMTTGYNREHTILFVSFDVEEQGLVGSRIFVNDWLVSWLASNYPQQPTDPYGVIVLDTIMNYNSTSQSQTVPIHLQRAFQQLFPDVVNHVEADNYKGDFLLLIHRQTPDSDITSAFRTQWASLDRTDMTGFKLESFPLPFVNLTKREEQMYYDFLRSDHTNFWVAGIPALFLTDSANLRGDMQHCYHKPCDNLKVMLTDENLDFLSKTSDAIFNTIHRLSEPTPKEPSHAGRAECQTWVVFVLLLFATFSQC